MPTLAVTIHSRTMQVFLLALSFLSQKIIYLSLEHLCSVASSVVYVLENILYIPNENVVTLRDVVVVSYVVCVLLDL